MLLFGRGMGCRYFVEQRLKSYDLSKAKQQCHVVTLAVSSLL